MNGKRCGMKKSHFGGFVSGLVLCFALAASWGVSGSPAVSAAEAKTGVGLSEHVLNASAEGWKYRYGCYGQFVSGVRCSDCSGLIKSYLWWTGAKSDPDSNLVSVAGGANAMLQSASESGDINLSDASTLPRVHGLILYSSGHVGVYVGGNLAVDNRCTGKDIQYQQVIGGRYHWKKWFKLPQIQYPQTGFVTFCGDQYYYENGQYVTGTTKTIGGVTCTFDASGKLTSGDVSAETKAVSAASGTNARVLQAGCRGGDVLTLQKRLTELGYMTSDNCTGYFGPITKAAVLTFQKAAGLAQTGAADSGVLESLKSSSAAAA
jgi:hypothetical protein